jgi:hypothetical protein
MNVKKLAQKYEQAKCRLNPNAALQITHCGTNPKMCEVIADGCRKVLTCDDVMVVFENVAGRRVSVTGTALRLRNWGADGVVISGDVLSVEFGAEHGGET